MGSFNVSCSFSGLPITSDEPAKIFLLQEHHHWSRSPFIGTSTFDLWSIRSLPISAKYVDSGIFDVPTNIISKSWFTPFKEDLVELCQGHNPIHDLPISFNTLGMAELFDGIYRGRVTVNEFPLKSKKEPTKDPPKGSSRISLGGIREDVWNFLLRQPIQRWESSIMFEEFLDEGRNFFHSKMGGTYYSPYYPFKITGTPEDLSNPHLLFLHLFQQPYISQRALGESILPFFSEETSPEDRELILTSLAEITWVCLGFQKLCRLMVPSSYCGQEGFSRENRKFLGEYFSFMNSILEEKEKEWKEEYGEEYE